MSTPNINSLLENVPKLNGKNYHNWKFAISMVLRRAGCWEVVSDKAEKPATRTSGGDWEKKAEEGLTAIGLTVEPSQYGYIRDCADGPEAWKALAAVYEKNSRATHISLKRQFYGFKHDITRPIREYLASITTLAARLKSIGIKLEDDDIIDIIIFNLDNEYSNIAASLSAAQGELKLSDVTGALIDEEARRNPDRDETVAMVSRTRKWNPNVICYNCNQRGHVKATCRMPPAQSDHVNIAAEDLDAEFEF